MHMADALVAPAVAGTMYAASAMASGYSVRQVKPEEEPARVAAMGVMGAFVFAAQMVNFTIPGTGSSGHLCGGVLLSAVLGPYAGFLTMVGILVIQCLMFADGGLLALGCNIWNMAAYSCLLGSFFIWKPLLKKGITKKRIVAASLLSSVISLQMGAFSVVLETCISGVTELPFGVFAGVMQPIHLAIGLVEGTVTAALLLFVYEARPELLWTGCRRELTGRTDEKKIRGRGAKTVIGILAAGTVLTAGIMALFASKKPDGLEWSIEKAAGSAEIEASGSVYALTEKIQNVTALFPDYGFSESNSSWGTVLSGLTGAAAVLALCIICSCLFRFFRKKKSDV